MKTIASSLVTTMKLAALAALLALPACTSATEETEAPIGIELAPSGVSELNSKNNPANYPRQVNDLGIACTAANDGQQWAENIGGRGSSIGYYVIQCGGGWWNAIEACWENQEPSCQQY